MFYGFAAAWIIVVGYLVLLGLRERKLKQQLEQVKALIATDSPSRSRIS